MSLVRSWRRAVLGASGAGLLVPVALVGVLAVTATVSGSGSVGGLSQLFAGPTVPRATQDTLSAAGAQGRTAGDVPPVPEPRPGTARRAPARGQADPGSGPRRERPGARTPTTRRRGAADPGTTVRPRPQAPATPAPADPPPAQATPDPPAPPPARPNPVRRIGTALADTVRQLPVVGEPVGDVVQTVVDLVVPPKPRAVIAPPAPAEPAPAAAPAAAAADPAAPTP